jgi:hypothetical protein
VVPLMRSVGKGLAFGLGAGDENKAPGLYPSVAAETKVGKANEEMNEKTPDTEV